MFQSPAISKIGTINFERLTFNSLPVLLITVLIYISGCSTETGGAANELFEQIKPSRSGIDFTNTLSFKQSFNIYRYRNFYNGGGVAIGDINNDGLVDIYFTSNQEKNRLYLNKGNFKFEDITDKAGVGGTRAWSTGVSMADVNGDGWLDIYVCNSGIIEGDDKKNELFINNGDLTFSEQAESYGIADTGLSIHGSFFDYDKDGDLDLYLVNNSYRAIGSFDLQENIRNRRDPKGGDKLFRNNLISSDNDEINRTNFSTNEVVFTDVSEEAGIYGSEIGFGLGVTVADINRDGWPDMYISNDFFERDYLYINNRDGTFSEILEEAMNSVSAAAMGADAADLNHDGFPEIFVTDMLPDDNSRVKSVTTFDSWERYQELLNNDYYHQFTRNTLQLNNGVPPGAGPEPAATGPPPVYFSEIGRMAGVEATDWSWGAMIADYNLDGHRDLFVANGIYQDLTNLDYLEEVSREDMVRRIVSGDNVNFKSLINMIPSVPLSNAMFAGRGGLGFTRVGAEWGLDAPGFSNGSAYGDLDNDGDLDLVVNNVNMEAFVYRNRTVEQSGPDGSRWLQLELRGRAPNTFGVGAQVSAWSGGRLFYAEQQPVRGFQSTVDHRLHLGLGGIRRLDSLVVRWPDGSLSRRNDVETGRRLTVRQPGAGASRAEAPVTARSDTRPLLEPLDPAVLGLDWRHRENAYNDFRRQPLLFRMRSTEGPAVCTGDANGDGLGDLYLGGAKDQPGAVYLQQPGGGFAGTTQPALAADRVSEDTDCVWVDVDGDGDQDLYVASGGSEFPASSSALIDRLYVNEGDGRLRASSRPLIFSEGGFEPTGAVAAADFNGDAHPDLFVGVRLRPFAYGLPTGGYLLAGDGQGGFRDVTAEAAPGLSGAGMITGARWGDLDGDGDPDLVLSGEWMPLRVFENRSGRLVEATVGAGLDSTAGWWNGLALADLDADGDLDLVAAGHGTNTRLRASRDRPMQLWAGDFDRNGTVEQLLARTGPDGQARPVALRHDLLDQLPSLAPKIPSYAAYGGMTVRELIPPERLQHAVHYRAVELRSLVGWNDGSGRFRLQPLPQQAQLAPMFGILAADLTGQGRPELLMGGNLGAVKPQIGPYMASYGSVMKIKEEGNMDSVSPNESGFFLPGETRSIHSVKTAEGRLIIVVKNDNRLQVYKISNCF